MEGKRIEDTTSMKPCCGDCLNWVVDALGQNSEWGDCLEEDSPCGKQRMATHRQGPPPGIGCGKFKSKAA